MKDSSFNYPIYIYIYIYIHNIYIYIHINIYIYIYIYIYLMAQSLARLRILVLLPAGGSAAATAADQFRRRAPRRDLVLQWRRATRRTWGLWGNGIDPEVVGGLEHFLFSHIGNNHPN